MTTAAVTMVKDEADIIASTVTNMLNQVDFVIVADNMSTDDTRPILEALVAGSDYRLRIVDDVDPRYLQSAKMTALAHDAHRRFDADWIVPFDADEMWYSPFGRIGDVLEDIAEQWLIAPAPLYDHVATGEDTGFELDPVARMGWRRRDPNPLPKVAVRWRPDLIIDQGNHGATYEGGGTRFDEVLAVRHFPYRSVPQLVRKIRNGADAYRAAGDTVRPDHGLHWRQWGDMLEAHGEPAIEELFRDWYFRRLPQRPHKLPNGETVAPLIYDPAPR